MTSTTVNKGYAIQSAGENPGIWGDILNTDVIEIIDSNLGGIVTKSVLGSNITLTADEAENCIVRLIGVQSADIQVTNPCVGFYFVENLTTNSFNITVTNGVAGVVVPKGRSTVIADPTNGCRIAGVDGFPPGTRMPFQQTAAPTGWTKDVSSTLNDAALRLNTGNVATGGTVPFSAAFASQNVTGTVGDTTLTIAQMPSHSHTANVGASTGSFTYITGAIGGLFRQSRSVVSQSGLCGSAAVALGLDACRRKRPIAGGVPHGALSVRKNHRRRSAGDGRVATDRASAARNPKHGQHLRGRAACAALDQLGRSATRPQYL